LQVEVVLAVFEVAVAAQVVWFMSQVHHYLQQVTP
jgi:hypothetical protein